MCVLSSHKTHEMRKNANKGDAVIAVVLEVIIIDNTQTYWVDTAVRTSF